MADWRPTFKSPKLLIVDARLSVFILLALIHFSKLTVGLALAAMGILVFVEVRKRMSLESSIRGVRMMLVNTAFSRKRPPRPYAKIGRKTDYGRILD